MDTLSPSPAASGSARQDRELFQAVYCGTLAVAFPYRWATSIVEEFQIAAVPKAPAWLFGACNIDGRIVPVIDLSRYGVRGMRADRNDISNARPGSQRLLIGGVHADNDDSRMAILFTGMPQQVGRSVSESHREAKLNDSSTTITDGVAFSTRGERFAVVNVNRLYEQLGAELSAL
jgi:chemotaxis signal transduction protein